MGSADKSDIQNHILRMTPVETQDFASDLIAFANLPANFVTLWAESGVRRKDTITVRDREGFFGLPQNDTGGPEILLKEAFLFFAQVFID